MKNLTLSIIAIIGALSFNSCDKVDTPLAQELLDTDGIVWDDSSYVESSSTMRKVLIEEFTGHTCTNCPQGAAELENLITTYGNQIVPMGIHSDATFCDPRVFADGTPAQFINGVAAYTTDFRTDDGDVYRNTFNVNGIPKGFVSRRSNGTPFGFTQWDSEIQLIQADVPAVSIGLSTLYNDSARTVKTVVTTNWLSSSAGDYKLQIQLVEDSLVDWQLDAGVDVPDYLHRHVFRGSINGTWGSDIPSANQGDIYTQEFSYVIPANFKKKDCIIVAFVYQDNPSYEIIQAEELHVTSH
ncbi:Omp28 family outer membrane lipoprotein [Vicingaceae bacterium]|nr:Omp28 family outer membrane lipoprotein [Vicingaceae bacterium]